MCYSEEVKKLLENGTAYYCFCNDRRLNLLKRDAIRRREVPKYDNRCRYLSDEEIQRKLDTGSLYCVRFKVLYLPKSVHEFCSYIWFKFVSMIKRSNYS